MQELEESARAKRHSPKGEQLGDHSPHSFRAFMWRSLPPLQTLTCNVCSFLPLFPIL
jgi:hypothetical protein